MSIVIDRRLNDKKKSTVNRQRFLRRYKGLVKDAVQEAIDERSITDIERGQSIHIPKKNLSEPILHHGKGGKHRHVHPGNKEFNTGDRIQRPSGGGEGPGGGGDASADGSGSDEFMFQINRDEFLGYLFDDLELPNLVRKELSDVKEFRLRRAGISTAGSPDRLNIVRSLRSAHARRIALSGKERHEIRQIKRELRTLEINKKTEEDYQQIELLKHKIRELTQSLKRLPFIDEFDLKFNNFAKEALPSSRAVMFCIMDVSGSMTREIKDMAKRFFLLLYMFLNKNYESVKVVFIRHHSEARECDEQDFFYARETGGTVVSTALNLAAEIRSKRFSPSEWNIYIAQASDGDNWESDSCKCKDIIIKKLLPYTQYYSYVEITDRNHQNLWHEYKSIESDHPERFSMEQIKNYNDIYKTFRRLFEKKEAKENA